MGYEVALNKSWDEFLALNSGHSLSVRFLADEYVLEPDKKLILSLACNVPAKDFTAILILHYLAQKIKGLPLFSGVWLPFREVAGIEGYYAAFKKRSIEPIIRKYGSNPAALLAAAERLGGSRFKGEDLGVIIEAFEGVPVLIKLWPADDEFGPDANIFFDRSISSIFCTEDIVVLSGIIAGRI